MAAKPKEPGFVERAINDLEEHFERGEHGKETGHERPEIEAEREIDPTKLGAKGFQKLTQEFERTHEKQEKEQRAAAAEKRKERVDRLLDGHLDDERWANLIGRAREAAKAGRTEFELLRFPSQLCSDGGRAINVTEDGWPGTLRGEAREIYERFENELKPQGFRLTARIIDFPDGFPGDAGLYLHWGE